MSAGSAPLPQDGDSAMRDADPPDAVLPAAASPAAGIAPVAAPVAKKDDASPATGILSTAGASAAVQVPDAPMPSAAPSGASPPPVSPPAVVARTADDEDPFAPRASFPKAPLQVRQQDDAWAQFDANRLYLPAVPYRAW